MPRTVALEKSKQNTRKAEASRLLKKLGRDVKNAFGASLDSTIMGGKAGDFILYRVSEIGNYFRDVGIEAGDILAIDISKTETPERDGIVCCVVTDERYQESEFVDFEFETDFGAKDILDSEFIDIDATVPTRRKRKGDGPRVKREILGVVTSVCRSVQKLRPIPGQIDTRLYFEDFR